MANERQRGNDIGETGTEVGRNVYRLRRLRDMSLKELESELALLGRRISWSGISKLENGTRKVDADDLVALAIALNVSPLALLLPNTKTANEMVKITAAASLPARQAWAWGVGTEPLDQDGDEEDIRAQVQEFRHPSKPWWLYIDSDVPSAQLNPTARAILEREHQESGDLDG